MKMNFGNIPILGCCLLLINLLHLTESKFCQQPGTSCRNRGTCDPTTQTCQCPRDFSSHDCLLYNPIIVPRAREYEVCGSCNNHGMCFSYNGLKACHCDFGFFGPNCQYKNITMGCTIDGVSVQIMTPGIKDVEVLNYPNCKFNSDSSPSDQMMGFFKYSRTFSMTDDPCAQFTVDKLSDTVEKRTLFVDVKRESGKYSDLDYIKELSCIYDMAISSSVESSEVHLFEAELLNFGNEPATTVAMRNEFSLVFYPSKRTLELYPNAAVAVQSLTMLNERTSQKMFDIIHNGCPTHAGRDLMVGRRPRRREPHRTKDGRTVDAFVVKFKAVHQHLKIAFDYAVEICQHDCPEPDCSGKVVPRTFRGLRVTIQ